MICLLSTPLFAWRRCSIQLLPDPPRNGVSLLCSQICAQRFNQIRYNVYVLWHSTTDGQELDTSPRPAILKAVKDSHFPLGTGKVRSFSHHTNTTTNNSNPRRSPLESLDVRHRGTNITYVTHFIQQRTVVLQSFVVMRQNYVAHCRYCSFMVSVFSYRHGSCCKCCVTCHCIVLGARSLG